MGITNERPSGFGLSRPPFSLVLRHGVPFGLGKAESPTFPISSGRPKQLINPAVTPASAFCLSRHGRDSPSTDGDRSQKRSLPSAYCFLLTGFSGGPG